MIGLFQFVIALPKIFLTASIISGNLNLIKSFLACAKKKRNATVITVNDVF